MVNGVQDSLPHFGIGP